MPIISVIVPVYKVEKYLARCVESILAQTFTDFELILVDDGSPDNCPALCDEFAKKDKRIHVIHQKNGGLSAARNAGIDWCFANSSSEWFSFIDSDDWIHPELLRTLYDAVTKNDVKLGVCNFVRTNGETIDVPVDNVVPAVISADKFLEEIDSIEIIACNKLYERDLFKGIRYPVGRIHEDLFTTPELVCKAGKIVFVDCPLYFYFQNSESITGCRWSKKRLDNLEACCSLIETMKRHNFKNAYRSACLYYFSVISYFINYMDVPNFQRFLLKFRRELMFLKLKKSANFTLKNDLSLYCTVFPFFTRLFGFCLFLQSTGLKYVFRLALSKITKKVK